MNRGPVRHDEFVRRRDRERARTLLFDTIKHRVRLAMKIAIIVSVVVVVVMVGFGITELVQDIRRNPQPYMFWSAMMVGFLALGLFNRGGGVGYGMLDTGRELYERRLRDGPVGRD